MKITRIESTPLAIPLAQEFHWAGGAQVGANLVHVRACGFHSQVSPSGETPVEPPNKTTRSATGS